MEQLIAKLLQDFEHGKMNRRQLIQSLSIVGAASAAGAGAAITAAPALAQESAPKGKGFHAVEVNHISYQVPDYKKTRDFYSDLLGMEVRKDDGRQCYLVFGDNIHIIPRQGRAGSTTPVVNHIAYTIRDWDRPVVEAELKRRGLNPRDDEGTSFHVKDPDGFDVQICSKDMKPE
jgi:catechol 2,3-dioxygenase-like lactoylglutathione lyase family enzyme